MIAPKILSVDDSKMIHMVITRAFKNYDVQLFFASNGVEGLAMCTRENPDIVLLDVTMPVMDGVETLSKIKADPVIKDIPVIMLTAEAGRENVVKIAKLGVRDYIIKPFTEVMIVERVGRVIDLQQKGATAAKIKTMADTANVLVVDDKPAIIEQIKASVGDSPWKVTGTSQCGEAIDIASKEVPDVILVSLSLPERAAFNFFQMMRANARTKSVPIIGMSVKTATEEQSSAQAMGFTGIVTKPLDVTELNFRLTRAMNLDTSMRYFTQEEGVQLLRVPNNPSTLVASEVTSYIGPKTREMVECGLNRLLLDVSEVTKIDMVVIKLILQVVTSCKELGIKFRVVGTKEFAGQSKGFEETKDLEIYADRPSALAGF